MIWVLGYSLYGGGDILYDFVYGGIFGYGEILGMVCSIYWEILLGFRNILELFGGRGEGEFYKIHFHIFLKNSPKFPNSINYLYITYFIRISPLSAKFAYSDFIRYNFGISYLIKNENPPPPISYLIKNENQQIDFVSYKKSKSSNQFRIL